jgi:hypothetical protein
MTKEFIMHPSLTKIYETSICINSYPQITGAIYDTPFLDYEKRFHLAVIHSLIGFDLHKLKFFFLKQKIENLE